MIKQAFKLGLQKKAQMGGLAGGVIALAIAGVVALIMVSVYNDVANAAIDHNGSGINSINGSTKTVFENIPVFVGLLILLAAAGGFAFGRR
jgi:cell division protein FtsX